MNKYILTLLIFLSVFKLAPMTLEEYEAKIKNLAQSMASDLINKLKNKEKLSIVELEYLSISNSDQKTKFLNAGIDNIDWLIYQSIENNCFDWLFENKDKIKDKVKNGIKVLYENSKEPQISFPFLMAARLGRIEICHLFFILGANINQQAIISGNTALHLAAISKNEELIEYLIRNGIDKNLKNNKNQTALDN